MLEKIKTNQRERVRIIAEAGVNHNGKLSLAKKLVDVAACAGVDYIKFQTFNTDLLVSKVALRAEYQIKNIGRKGSQYEMLKQLEISQNDFKELKTYCDDQKVSFLSTAFDLESIDFLINNINLEVFKIPSGEITNIPYLRKIAKSQREVILSTGMSDLHEIEIAVNELLKNGVVKDKLTLLHCNSEYPTPMEDVNLRAMQTLKQEFGLKVGLSDHSLGIEVPIAAVALGASIIEKHYTLDKSLPGPDHVVSLSPDELQSMVSAIRNVENALGDGTKRITESERKNRIAARKSIHLSKDLQMGHALVMDDLIMLRPGDGISPLEVDDIVGRRLKQGVSKYTQLSEKDLV